MTERFAYAYCRGVGPRSFWNEEPFATKDQHAAVLQFFRDSLEPAGYSQLHVYTEKEGMADVRGRWRPALQELLRNTERHDAIIVPRLRLMFADRRDLHETLWRVHRRRLLVFFLDLPPRPCPDSGSFLLAGIKAYEDFNTETMSDWGRKVWDKLAAKHGGEHPLVKSRRLSRRRAKKMPWYDDWLKEHEKNAKLKFIFELREKYNWSFQRIVDYFTGNRFKPPVRVWSVHAAQRLWYRHQERKKKTGGHED